MVTQHHNNAVSMYRVCRVNRRDEDDTAYIIYSVKYRPIQTQTQTYFAVGKHWRLFSTLTLQIHSSSPTDMD